MKKRIICVGNRFKEEDAAGPLVYDQLMGCSLPHDLEVIDGGLAGLNLLRFVEDADQVVFVDAMTGFEEDLKLMDAEQASEYADIRADHANSLAYLLKSLPHLLEGTMPEVTVLGIQGIPSGNKIKQAARMGLNAVSSGDPHP